MPSLSDVSSLADRIQGDSSGALAGPMKIVILLTLLSVVPSVLMLTTAFTRIVIVLAFIRTALSTRSIPPNQVILGLALFLTLFVMAPTMRKVNTVAIQPYIHGSLSAQQAIEQGFGPLREFMFSQTDESDMEVFVSLSGIEKPQTREDVPTYVLIPSFTISELKRAFELGFVLFLPFLVVDLIVASVLLSMGMIMVPPVMISAPLEDTALRAGGRLAPDRPVADAELRRLVGMTQQMVIFLARRMLLTGLIVVGPLLAADLLVGIAVGVFQAVTSIREMTLSMIPKILIVVGVLIWLMPWMLGTVVVYTAEVMQWVRFFGT